MDDLKLRNIEFRKKVLHKIYEVTQGRVSECINRVEEVQSIFPQEESKQVFAAVDYLLSEGLLSGKKYNYIGGNGDIFFIRLTAKGINSCEGVEQMSRPSQYIQINGNTNANILVGDNSTQTIQTTETQLDQLIQLVEELLRQKPNSQELIEIMQLMQEQKAEGKPSKSFLKAVGRTIKNIAINTGGTILAAVAAAPILTALGL